MAGAYLYNLEALRLPRRIGRKAQELRFLKRRSFQVPSTWVCPWDAYREYQAGRVEVVGALRSEVERNIDLSRRYAVRSSANVEDGGGHSFAGQFQTALDVQGVEDILGAIQAVWASAHAPEASTYLRRAGIEPADLEMAVIVQEMVDPVVSGVSFSKNPMTGLDEVVVEAVLGSGEALVQEGITPGRWVNRWGTWVEQPDQEGIPLTLIQDVVRQTKAIAEAYGQPVDLEWVFDGRALWWVQLRPITALDLPIYSNRISREVFPGVIKPLVWSVNVPLVNGAWVRLLTELIGPNDIDPESLAGYFYSRAYFNMGTLGEIFERLGLPRETLELLMGIEVEGPERPAFKPTSRTYALLPRLLCFAAAKLRFTHVVEGFLSSMWRKFHTFPWAEIQASERELLDEIDRLYPLAQEAAYYNIVTPLHMYLFNQILKGQLGQIGVDFGSFDVTQGVGTLQGFDPNSYLDRLHGLYRDLDPDMQARVRGSTYDEFCRLPGIGPLQEGVGQFLEEFGHLSDSGNDFSSVPWRENPDLVLRMVTRHVLLPPTAADDKVGLDDLHLAPIRRWWLQSLRARARRFRWYREAVSSLYTYGYGLFRPYFLALGERFARRGILASPADIFYLSFAEVRAIVETGGEGERTRSVVNQRKREIEQVRDITPPAIIYGDQPPTVDAQTNGSLKGIPTSRGRYTGPVRVLLGIQDLDRLREGDVLVIPFSDVGWTPLFAKASAVVAESGGILSHSSIVAREYGIPAVVSVPGACRLAEDTLVTVDGFQGQIIIHDAMA
jgi:phosphohistidine swiveling domain-containing protein